MNYSYRNNPRPFIPLYGVIHCGGVHRNMQKADDLLHGLKEEMKNQVPPSFQHHTQPRSLQGQKNVPYWVNRRVVRGALGPESDSVEFERSSASDGTSDSKGRRQQGLGPVRVSYNYSSNMLHHGNGNHSAVNYVPQSSMSFYNKRQSDGNITHKRTPCPSRHYVPHQYMLPPGMTIGHNCIAPDEYLSKSHLVQVEDTPKDLLKGNKWDKLSQEIWDKFISCQQTEDMYKNKMTLWKFLYISIKNMFPQYSVHLVGSTVSGFGSNSSDMDLCLLMPSQGIVNNRLEALRHLDIVLRFIKNMGMFVNAEMIAAKVPILKFRDSCYSLEVDLNCNNVVGIRNTHLLYCYAQLDWRVRPLVLIIKLWAQHNNINDPKNKTVSSYSLVLMVINYLQCGVSPCVLPCLQKEYPDKFNPHQDIQKINLFDQIPKYCSKNQQSLGELLFGFFKYYSDFNYKTDTISVGTGGLLNIASCWYQRRFAPREWKLLCVEEPFDLSNTARSVYDAQVFSNVLQVFRFASSALNGDPSIKRILPPK